MANFIFNGKTIKLKAVGNNRIKMIFLLFLLCLPSVALPNPAAKEIQNWITYSFKSFEVDDSKFFLKRGEDDCTIEAIWSHNEAYDNKTEIDFSRNITVKKNFLGIMIKDPTEQFPEQSYNFNPLKYKHNEEDIYGKPTTSGLVLVQFSDADQDLRDRFMNAFSNYLDECRKVNTNLF